MSIPFILIRLSSGYREFDIHITLLKLNFGYLSHSGMVLLHSYHKVYVLLLDEVCEEIVTLVSTVSDNNRG